MARPDADAGGSAGAGTRRSTLRALWYISALAFKADPWRATGALVTAAIGTAGQQVTAFMTSRVIAAVIHHDSGHAVALAVWTAIIGVASTAAAIMRLDLRFRMEEATALLIDRDLITMMATIPGLEQHERPEHLDRLELVRNERGNLSGSVGSIIENVSTVSSIVTTTGLLAAVDIRLLLLPVFGIPSVAASAVVRGWWHKTQERTAERQRLAKHLFELGTTGPPAKELRVFGLRDEVRARFDAVTDEVDREVHDTSVKGTLVSTGGWLVFAFAYVGSVAMVVQQAIRGEATAADVVLVISLAQQVSQQVSSVYWMVGWVLDTMKTVSRYLRLRDDAAAASVVVNDPAPPPDRLRHGIDLVDVAFRYPGTETDVLRGVNLHLPAGATVAVVGDNGAGKSTLVKLLCGFYSPSDGEVLVDGVALSRIPLAEWRARMSAGFQDFARLELVARETVGVGDLPFIDDAEFVSGALGRASADDVVLALSGGLETQLGRTFEGGMELSGGQWQKLALGRAMMRERPLLLVLDEPTAALDADTEHALFERYAGAARQAAEGTGGITVLVSHRFSTVRMADLIVVVGDGVIAECGSHEELMAQGGVYAELYELQARAYR